LPDFFVFFFQEKKRWYCSTFAGRG
jgi:hypothetical protein